MSEARPPALPDERDAWLHQALRHAPDATAAPPNALREAILAQAQSAAQARRRATGSPSFFARAAAFWSWLARPPIAAGFASIMAATLVGLMWWDRPMDETLMPPPATSSRVVASPPPSPPAQPSPPAADVLASPRPAPVAPTATARLADRAASRRAQAALAKTVPTAATATTESRKDEPTVPAPVSVPAPPPRSVPPASPFPGTGPSEGGTFPESLRDARRQAAPSIAEKAESQARNNAQVSGNVAALAKPASPARERAATPSRRDGAETADALGAGTAAPPPALAAVPQAFSAAPPIAAAPAPSPPGPSSAAKASPRPMAALLVSIAQETARWSRQAAGGARPTDASIQVWLAEVDTAAGGRWQSTADHDPRSEPITAAPGFAVLLDRDSHAAAVIRIDDTGVFFRQEPGAAWFAPLPADAIARLRAALPR